MITESRFVSTDAEMALIGALLTRPKGFVEVAGIVSGDDFVDGLCRKIFEEAQWLYDCTESLDIVLLRSRLGVGVDSAEMNACISAMEDVPSSMNAASYARLVRESSRRRLIAQRATELARAARNEAEFSEVLGMVDGLGSFVNDEATVARHIAQIETGTGDFGVTTTYPELDKLISTGGFPIGQTSIVMAYHKGGKTTMMLSCALRMARKGKRVLYATFADLSSAQLRRRWLRMLCGWSTRPESHSLVIQFDAAEEVLNGLDIVVYDSARSDRYSTVEAFASWVRGTHEIRPYDAVFVDYAQKIESARREAQSDQVLCGKICSKALANLAARIAVPVIVGSQTTPGGKDSVAITKGTRAWEEDAGWVLGIATPEDEPNIRTVSSVWSRFGLQKVSVNLSFNEEKLSFE